MLSALSIRRCLAIGLTAVVLLVGMGANFGHPREAEAYQHNQTDLEFIEAASHPARQNADPIVYGSHAAPVEFDSSKNEVAIET